MNNSEKLMLWEKDIPYFQESLAQDPPTLTPYSAPAATDEFGKKKKTGCVIVCPGGSYIVKAEHEGKPVAEYFQNQGISAFLLDYRVYPYDHRAIKADINRAVRWVRYHADEYNIDPDKIALIGFSAGGHLAALGATNYDRGRKDGDDIDRISCRPDAAIISYAVISMTPDITHEHTRYVLIGRSPREERDSLVKQFSGELAVTSDAPPMFLWHTATDDCVDVENTIVMAGALSRHKVPFELHVFDKGPHSLGIAKDHPGAEQWTTLAVNWLKRMNF